MPKVSVIVPCYNQACYLTEALQSVLEQTYQDWECIIVNDGSPDDTEAVAKAWCTKDSRFHYLKKENGGLSSARNAGIGISEGEYILPLDADDKIGKEFIKKVLSILQTDRTIMAVNSVVQYFGLENSKIELQGGSMYDFMFQNRSTATALFRKIDFLRIGGYDETFKRGYEDWDFWLRLLKKGGNVVMITESQPEYLFYYRKKENSMLVESEKKHAILYKELILKNIDVFSLHCADVIAQKEELLMHYCYLQVITLNENEKLIKQIDRLRNHIIFKTIDKLKMVVRRLSK